MTQPAASSDLSRPDLLELVQRCKSLCQSAERSLGKVTPDREDFLTQNLSAAIQQVELVMRVLDENTEGHRDAERQSLLKRLFARSGSPTGGDPNSESDGQPKRDAEGNIRISSQGLQGNSWTVSVAELLGFLAFAHKTGVLWVDTPRENFLLGIVNGNLMHASSDHTPEGLRLGEVLVGLGFLTRRQLERFLESRPEGESVSGEVLLESGMIADDELRQALTCQVRKLFSRLVETDQAVFRFQDGINVQLAYQVDLDINQLLLDSARTTDEVESPALKAASAVHEWNSWTQGLGDKLEDVTSQVEQLAADESQPVATSDGGADSSDALHDDASPNGTSTRDETADGKSSSQPAKT